jgi:hypothetical protein
VWDHIYNNVNTAAHSNGEAGPAIDVVGPDTTMAVWSALDRIAGKKCENQREQAAKMIKMQGKDITKKEQLLVLWLLFSVITMQSAILLELSVLFTRLANLAVQGLLRSLEYYCLGQKRGHGGSHQISMLWDTVQTRTPTLLHNWQRYVWQ